MEQKVDACIVGGGVVGMFLALKLAEEGNSVRVVDKLFTGSSRKNVGDVILLGNEDATLPFVNFTHNAWKEASEKYGADLGFEERGSVRFVSTEVELKELKEKTELSKKHGFDVCVLEDKEKICEKLGISEIAENVIGAKFSEGDGAVETARALDTLRQRAIRQGVMIWGSDEVVSFIKKDDEITGVITKDGEKCEAKKTYLCSGIWGAKLLKENNVKVPLRPARSHIVELSPSRKMPERMLKYREKNGDIIIKYQKNGKAIVSYTGRMDQAQATWSNEVDEECVNWLLKRVGEILPALKGATKHSVFSITTAITPDGLPYVGEIAGLKNLYLALGFNGKSYAYAAGIAKVFSLKDYDDKINKMLEPFNPNRFS